MLFVDINPLGLDITIWINECNYFSYECSALYNYPLTFTDMSTMAV